MCLLDLIFSLLSGRSSDDILESSLLWPINELPAILSALFTSYFFKLLYWDWFERPLKHSYALEFLF